MIIAQAPYRISFAGGGTDLPEFADIEGGAVLSATIDRHVYVTLHPRFGRNDPLRVNGRYDPFLSEIVESAAKQMGTHIQWDAWIASDLPSGTGMGGSGAIVVALLVALEKYSGKKLSASHGCPIVERAVKIESAVRGVAIGRQDQMAAYYGGLRYMTFGLDGDYPGQFFIPEKANQALADMCLLCYTGMQRDSGTILTEQAKRTPDMMPVLREMKSVAAASRIALSECDFEKFACLVDQGWLLKRSLGCGISNPGLDEWYAAGLRAGALGGKLLGAGGGGFMLFLARPEKHGAILEALNRPRTVPVQFSRGGAKVIFDDGVRL